MKTKILLFLGLLFSLNCSAQKNDSNYANWKLSLNCLGPICVGMTVEQASKASGMKFELEREAGYAPPDKQVENYKSYKDLLKEAYHCFYISSQALREHAQFMVTNSRISRIEIYSNKLKTLSGIEIGDSERKLREVYKHKIVKDNQNKYHLSGEDLNSFIYKAKDKKDQQYKLLFITDGKKVIHIRSGFVKEVDYCEGCL